MSGAAGRVPSKGWYVEVVHPSGNVLRPQVNDGATPRPTLKGLPEVELPVDRDDKWLNDAFDRATVRVWQDGTRVPVETLVDRTHRADETILTARGGDELTKRIERNVVEQESHTFVDNLASSETSLATHVDTPINTTTTNSPLLSADTAADLENALRDAIQATDPIKAASSEIQLLQSAWVDEAENLGSASGTDSGSEYSGGSAVYFGTGLSKSGDKIQLTFTPGYDIPASNVGVALREDAFDFEGSGDTENLPPIDVKVDGEVVDSFPSGWGWGFSGPRWRQVTSGVSSDLTAGQQVTVTIEQPAAHDGDKYLVDVLALYDTRFSYSFDNTLDANDALAGPEKFPHQWDVVFAEVQAVQSVSGGRIEVTMNDTGGNQQLAISDDGGATWYSAANSTAYETDFGSLVDGVAARVRLSRFGSQTTTPTAGINGQTLDTFDLFADLDTTPIVTNKTFDGELRDVLNTVADDGDFIWEVVWDDSAGSLALEWTQPGQRTASGDPDIIDFEVSIDSSSVTEKAVVYGTSRAVRDEEITADSGTPVALDNAYNQPGQISVRAKSDGTEYTLGVDYTYDALGGGVTALSGGAITDGEVLLVDYRARVRGEYALGSWSGDETLATTEEVPGATTDRAAAQAAYTLVQQTSDPITTATVTIDRFNAGWNLVDTLSLAELPAPGMEIWSNEDLGGKIRLRLGDGDPVEEVVGRLRSRLEATASKI